MSTPAEQTVCALAKKAADTCHGIRIMEFGAEIGKAFAAVKPTQNINEHDAIVALAWLLGAIIRLEMPPKQRAVVCAAMHETMLYEATRVDEVAE